MLDPAGKLRSSAGSRSPRERRSSGHVRRLEQRGDQRGLRSTDRRRPVRQGRASRRRGRPGRSDGRRRGGRGCGGRQRHDRHRRRRRGTRGATAGHDEQRGDEKREAWRSAAHPRVPSAGARPRVLVRPAFTRGRPRPDPLRLPAPGSVVPPEPLRSLDGACLAAPELDEIVPPERRAPVPEMSRDSPPEALGRAGRATVAQRRSPKMRSRNRNRLMKSRYSWRAPKTAAFSIEPTRAAMSPFLIRWTSNAVSAVNRTTPTIEIT